MLNFESDYTTGAHPKILQGLIDTNMEALSGYGSDKYTESAINKIKKACESDSVEVYFAVGGTQTNQLVISSMLKSYEGVIAATTGHVSSHEAGAIEYSGHKVLTIPSHDGKINAGELEDYLKTFFNDGNNEHMVFPGMVYISQPTEYGSIYSKEELTAISKICRDYEILLYVDGARLGYALAGEGNDLSLAEITKLVDVFYIGGTKVGALCGEAIVFARTRMPKHFVTMAKQRGALLAKGRLLGLMFDILFTDDLYFKNSTHAMAMRNKLVEVLEAAKLDFYYKSPTNQQFVVIENEKYNKLKEQVAVSFWEKYDEKHTVVRFATSWSTSEEDIDALDKILKAL